MVLQISGYVVHVRNWLFILRTPCHLVEGGIPVNVSRMNVLLIVSLPHLCLLENSEKLFEHNEETENCQREYFHIHIPPYHSQLYSNFLVVKV